MMGPLSISRNCFLYFAIIYFQTFQESSSPTLLLFHFIMCLFQICIESSGDASFFCFFFHHLKVSVSAILKSSSVKRPAVNQTHLKREVYRNNFNFKFEKLSRI